MTTILQELPYHDTLTDVTVEHQLVQVLPHQIVVWVSLSLRGVLKLPEPTRRFPAVLDTGNSYGFANAERHLEQWAGMTRQAIEQVGSVRINRVSVPRLDAAVWLHCNKKGERDAFRRTPPFRLPLRDGIALYPQDVELQAPRLPLVGLRALDENKLQLFVYGDRLRVTIRTAPPPRQPKPAGGSEPAASP